MRTSAAPIPAAQYLRMSTEHQQYSIDNQSAAIDHYAKTHGFEIVQTYLDEARSGLTIAERPGLRALIDDITVGRAEFAAVLVLDVSRWGRFQDADEAAHYEFLCKLGGIKVHYCAEQFSNVEGMAGNLLKALKRSMAAEYSRELSSKVFAGQCRIVQNGFKIGGAAGYALRRLLLDQSGNPKAILKHGERKSLTTEHVTYALGTEQEQQIVRSVYVMFLQGTSAASIAMQLNAVNVPREVPGPWSRQAVMRILTHPKYTGCIVFNQSSSRLHTKKVWHKPDKWVVNPARFPAIVPAEIYRRVQEKLANRVQNRSDKQLLDELRAYVHKHGSVSSKHMCPANGLASFVVYRKRFGSLKKVYDLIPYRLPRSFNYGNQTRRSVAFRAEIHNRFCSELIDTKLSFAVSGHEFTVFNRGVFTLEVGKCVWLPRRRSVRWRVYSRPNSDKYPCIVVRLNEGNETVRDCCLFPSIPRTKWLFTVTQQWVGRFAIVRPTRADMAGFIAAQEPHWLQSWAHRSAFSQEPPPSHRPPAR